MPQQTKAKWARLRVGLLAIAAMFIVAILVFLITGNTNPFSTKTDVITYMNDAASLTQGAPVNLNGIPVGLVKNIALSGSRQQGRIVRIDMEIPADRLKDIPSDSVAAISASNILGTKFINITMGKSTTPVRPGAEIKSLNTEEFEDLVQRGYSVLDSLQATVNKVNDIIGLVESGKGSIGKLLVDQTLYDHILKITDSVQKLADALNSTQGTFGKLIYERGTYDQIQGTLTRLDSLLQNLQAGQGTAGKLLSDAALYNDSEKTVAEIRDLIANLNAGKGTAGKLLTSDQLHTQALGTMNKIDTLTEKVDSLMDKMNSGQGTIGQLLVNKQLYDTVNGTTAELHELLKDFRSNPKKFLHIKLSLF